MEKDFGKWSIKKQGLNERVKLPIIKGGEIFWCSIGINIGDEENGKGELFARPVLVFRKFSSNLFWGIPLTSQNKYNEYYIQIKFKETINSAMISHLRLYDVKRLGLRMGRLNFFEYNKIIKSVTNLIPKPLGEAWGCD